MLAFGSLFAGIGGFDLGLERAGMRCAWQVEIDPFCQKVLAKHWPDVKRYGDVRDVGKHNLESVDVICGGFPCQDVSVAGRREGLAGERSGLWFEFHRIIEELKPGWVIVENVPGLLSSNGGRDFAVIVSGLAECGYGIAWRILDAQYAGVPQRRRRVFIVGHLGDGRAAQVLFERTSSAWDSAPSREAGASITQAVTGRLGGGGPDDNKAQGNFLIAGHCTGHGWWNQSEIASTLRAEGENRPSRPSNIIAYGISENQRSELRLTDYSRQITSGGGKPGQGYPAALIAYGLSGRVTSDGKWDNQSHSKGGPTGFGITEELSYSLRADRQMNVGSYFGVRRLTPRECERLQGFPDDFTAWGVDESGDRVSTSDSARYRMLGNAVAVPVAEWIGRHIVEVASDC